jgi:hypothetical protein
MLCKGLFPLACLCGLNLLLLPINGRHLHQPGSIVSNSRRQAVPFRLLVEDCQEGRSINYLLSRQSFLVISEDFFRRAVVQHGQRGTVVADRDDLIG